MSTTDGKFDPSGPPITTTPLPTGRPPDRDPDEEVAPAKPVEDLQARARRLIREKEQAGISTLTNADPGDEHKDGWNVHLWGKRPAAWSDLWQKVDLGKRYVPEGTELDIEERWDDKRPALTPVTGATGSEWEIKHDPFRWRPAVKPSGKWYAEWSVVEPMAPDRPSVAPKGVHGQWVTNPYPPNPHKLAEPWEVRARAYEMAQEDANCELIDPTPEAVMKRARELYEWLAIGNVAP